MFTVYVNIKIRHKETDDKDIGDFDLAEDHGMKNIWIIACHVIIHIVIKKMV